jgi:hypothetical protein
MEPLRFLAFLVVFLLPDQFRITGVTGSVVFTLAGYFQMFSGEGFSPTARRHTFGWYAQIGVG